jgi:hypothetical protein
VDVAAWLSRLGLERYVEAFEVNDIDAAGPEPERGRDQGVLFKGSDGNHLEILQFPAGRAIPGGCSRAARWSLPSTMPRSWWTTLIAASASIATGSG